MKILIVGYWRFAIYEAALQQGFKQLGCTCDKFEMRQYFDGTIWKRVNYKFAWILGHLERDLLKRCIAGQYDLIFFYGPRHISARVLQKIKASTRSKLFAYQNDDPFSKQFPWWFWRLYLRSLSYYDYIFYYRNKNLADYQAYAYNRVSLLRSYYIKTANFPRHPDPRYQCGVIFIGHYEPDGRDEYIKAIFDAGINFKLYGQRWPESKYYAYFCQKMGAPIEQLWNEEYNVALSSSKIALVFLSKLNNDTYTRRCFEIPAAKVMMLCERTADMQTLFQEGRDADYFSNPTECVAKLKAYMKEPEKLARMSVQGHQHLLASGHEVTDRCKQVLDIYQKIIAAEASN